MKRQIRLGRFTLPGLMLGSSPFCGSRQFGAKAVEYYRKFFGNPLNMTDLLVWFYRSGYHGAHVLALEPMGKAILEAYRQLGQRFPVIVTLLEEDQESQWRWIRRFETAAVFLHANETDRLDFERLKKFCDRCKKEGVVPGFSTHQGGSSIPQLDRADLDHKVYLCPINPTGAHLHPSLEATAEALQNTSRIVIGMKVLSCGQVPPRTAFPFVSPLVDAIAVGMVTREEIDENVAVFEENFM